MFAVVKVEGDRRVLTVRATAFETAYSGRSALSDRTGFDLTSARFPRAYNLFSREERKSDRLTDRSPRGRIWRQTAEGQGTFEASGRWIGDRRRRHRRHSRRVDAGMGA